MLGQNFLRHVATRPSGLVACSVGVASEAWFRVEIAHMLLMAGLAGIRFGYDYPASRQKGDLACVSDGGLSVFELKCFVRGSDANKMQNWPEQVARLLDLVRKGTAKQGLAVSTYFGYTEEKMAVLISNFHPPPWRRFGPRRFFENAPLQLVVGSVTPADLGPPYEVQ